jgi:hypothetical protein
MVPRRLSAFAVALVVLSIAVFGTVGPALAWERLEGSPSYPAPSRAEQHGMVVPAAIVAGAVVELRTQAPRPVERGRVLAGVHAGPRPSLQGTNRVALTPWGDRGTSMSLAVAPSRSPPSLLLS